MLVHWIVDSNPAGVGISAFLPTLVPRPFGLIEALLRMIALQLTGSVALVLLAAWQLRPASRALHDGEWPVGTRWISLLTRQRPSKRGPCGDDPVLWNELHLQRARSIAGRLLAGLVRLVGFGVLALGVSWFALPAFAELAERGYGASRRDVTMPEINPLARVLIGKFFFPTGSAAPGQARLEFNIALRQFSAIFVMLYVVMVAGTAAMSVVVEQERDTWQSLIATSLTGWDILRAKMLAAIWRARGQAWLCRALGGRAARRRRASAGFRDCRPGPARDRSVLCCVRGFCCLCRSANGSEPTTRSSSRPLLPAFERAGDPLAGQCERLAGSLLEPLSDLVVALLLRRRPGPAPLGRATATGRDEHQTRRQRPDGAAGCLIAVIVHARRGGVPLSMELPEV